MSEPVLTRLLLPVADEADAEATCEAVRSYVEAGSAELIVLHVVDASNGATDNPPPKPTDAVFDPFRETFSDDVVSVRAKTRAGTDVLDEIVQTADDVGATAIGVLPRPKNFLSRIFPKDENVSKLVSKANVPIVVFSQTSAAARPTFDAETGDWTPTLLIPFGESDRSQEAVAFACAAYPRPRLIGLHVFTASDTDVYSEITPGVSSELDEADSKRKHRVKAMFRKAVDHAKRDGVEMETVTAPGDVVKAILHYAREESVDMIIVGLAEEDRPGERGLGKLSRSLIRESPVPVVLI
jgi:nucleotide-binding universal stress UspA family protein